jgi:hypothetical protein
MTGINQNGTVSCAAPPVELLAARITGAAAIVAASGATGALKLGTGTYEVQFNRDVSLCYYSASTQLESGCPCGRAQVWECKRRIPRDGIS